MSDGVLDINNLNDLIKQLNHKVKILRQYGKEEAEKTKAYNVALASEITRLKNEGIPSTIVEKVAKGNIAKIIFDRDIATVMYETAQEDINATKLQIRVLESQIQREWGQSK